MFLVAAVCIYSFVGFVFTQVAHSLRQPRSYLREAELNMRLTVLSMPSVASFEVLFRGTRHLAQLAAGSTPVAVGDEVRLCSAMGNTLVCKRLRS